MAGLSLDGVAKRFEGTAAVADVTLSVANGGFLAILGPSGCGKTTLLRLIAGFEQLDAGTIRIGDRVVSSPSSHVPPEQRRIAIVFQNYALWPHLTVADNIAYSLKVRGMAKSERDRRVDEMLALVGLAEAGGRDTASLSGGQRQRVALARCLVMEPDLILLDEPLANLDQHLRAAMQAEFRQFQERTSTTMIYITHDQTEAMALADSIAVMGKGHVLQHAAPHALFSEPATPEVARFIGEGIILPVEVVRCADAACDARVFGKPARLRCRPDTALGPNLACFRPGDFKLQAAGDETLALAVVRVIYQGGFYRVDATVTASPTHSLHLTIDATHHVKPGEILHVVLSGGWVLPHPPMPLP